MEATWSRGPLPVSAISFIASNSSRLAPVRAGSIRLSSNRPRYCSSRRSLNPKNSGRADGPKGPGDVLPLVVEIGKREGVLVGKGTHTLEGICGIGLGIIGADGDARHAERVKITRIPNQAVDDGLNVGAVIADELTTVPRWPLSRARPYVFPSVAGSVKSGAFQPKSQTGGCAIQPPSE
jgi:hypothetical protein